jgi:hypothetical protein
MSRVLLLGLALATSGTACKRAATTAVCREDVDCPAGFDCVASACVRRQRMRFGVDARPTLPPPGPPPSDAGQPTRAETAAPAPTAPPPPPPAPPPPPPPGERLPMWKERLKNS